MSPVSRQNGIAGLCAVALIASGCGDRPSPRSVEQFNQDRWARTGQRLSDATRALTATPSAVTAAWLLDVLRDVRMLTIATERDR